MMTPLKKRFSQRLRPKVIVLDDDMISLEAALYVSGRALTLEELADIIGKSQSTAQKILDNLSFEYNKRDGALEVVALPKDRYVMQLKPELTPRVGNAEHIPMTISETSLTRSSLLGFQKVVPSC